MSDIWVYKIKLYFAIFDTIPVFIYAVPLKIDLRYFGNRTVLLPAIKLLKIALGKCVRCNLHDNENRKDIHQRVFSRMHGSHTCAFFNNNAILF